MSSARCAVRVALGLALVAGAAGCGDDEASAEEGSDEGAPGGEPELVLVARLLSEPPETPDCGTQHVAAAMPYQVERVIEGRYERSRIFVIHGCPELSRADYGDAAGELSALRPGRFHRLELVRRRPERLRSVSVVDELGDPGIVRWWALRADPAR